MHCRWILFQLEIKKFMKILPAILLETVLFAILLLGAGAYATKAIYGGRTVNEIKVGVAAQGEDAVADTLFKFVGAMDSIKDSASFEMLSEEEAREKLKLGEIYAAIIVPEGIIENILSGKNVPARILLSKAYSKMETEVFAQLSRAGAGLLTTAQAGIYAADAFCTENGQTDRIGQTEDFLNEVYLEYALGRSALFKEKEVNAVKGVNLTDYYCISLLFAFLSFAGLSFGRYMQVKMGERQKLVKSRGIGRMQQYLIETAAFSIVFALLGTIVSLPVYLFVIYGSKSSFLVAATWAFMIVIWFFAGVFMRALFQLVGNQAGGIGIGFVFLMALMLASGVFIPQAFLPSWMEKVGSFVPYKVWMESMTVILQGKFDMELAVKGLWIAVLSLAAGSLMTAVRENWRSHDRSDRLRGRRI